MAKEEIVKVLQTDLHEHPAILAWRELNPTTVDPERIEILKWKPPEMSEVIGRLFVGRLVDVGPAGGAVIVKRCRREKAVIENEIYEKVLPFLPISCLDYYGMVEEADGKYCWLFLEDAGELAYSSLDNEHCATGMRWLSLMQTSATRLTPPACLPDKGPDGYLHRLQFERQAILTYLAALTLRDDEIAPMKVIVSLCDKLESQWDQVKAFCEGAPQTLVHGDFVPRNLGLRRSQAGLTLLPFDWGEGGWGIPAVDIMDVDASCYWPMVRGSWPWLSRDAIQRLANVGKIFRSIDAVYWILANFKYKPYDKPVICLKIYATWLVDAIRAAGLN